MSSKCLAESNLSVVKTLPDRYTAWDKLLEMALLALDESGEERLRKRKVAAEKALKRKGLKAPPIDAESVKRVLLLYSSGLKFDDAMNSVDVAYDDLHIAYALWPESKTVMEYVRDRNYEKASMADGELVIEARKKLRDMIADDKGVVKVNPKVIELALCGLDREKFGKQVDVSSSSGGDDRRVVYHIEGNVTVNNLIEAPASMLKKKAEAIDVS